MSEHDLPSPSQAAPVAAAETGSQASKPSVWRRLRFLFKVVEIRLRFILVLVATFVLVGNWDTVKNLWDRWRRPSAAAVRDAKDIEYFCPMHPSVVRDSMEPDGSVPKCPICGMPLSSRHHGEAAHLPPGVTARVQLSPERIQIAGIATATVEYRPLVKHVSTVGFVDYDETGRSQIVSRTAGFVEKLLADKSYTPVVKGQPLAVIYSPDLASTAADLVLAINRGATDLIESGKQRLRLMGVADNEIDEIVAWRQLLAAPGANAAQQHDQAIATLRRLGKTDDEIADVRTSKKPPSGLIIRSPVNGHVVSKNIVQGARVEAGATLFDVADLSHVWIEAEVFESDIPLLKPGQKVEATLEGLPGQTIEGQVLLVHPHIEAATRTNRIRVDLPNPEHALRPGMYASVKVDVPLEDIEPFKAALAKAAEPPTGKDDAAWIAFQETCPVTGNKLGSMGPPVRREASGKPVFLCCPACEKKFDADPVGYVKRLAPPPADKVLSVPERAVIDTGSKKIVYVEREPGSFDGVEVQLGPETQGYFPVLNGLRDGDRVAAAGAFLVDAETRLNPAAGAAYVGASGGPAPAATSAAVNSQAPSTNNTTPTRSKEAVLSDDGKQNLEKLSAADHAAALAQKTCPISGELLGEMGVPVRITLAGKSLFLCCENCEKEAQKNPDATIAKLMKLLAK